MKTIKLSQASRSLAEYAADLGNEIVLLTERGKAVAAIVPLKGADRETLVLSGHPEFLDIIERSRAEFREGHTVSLEAMKRLFPQGRSTRARKSQAAKRNGRHRTRG
jgi:antitoxin (DNA-binding transcriptional repressor) of toxin-antitoxin stability system